MSNILDIVAVRLNVEYYYTIDDIKDELFAITHALQTDNIY